MCRRGQQHNDGMKVAYPNVEAAGPDSFRYACSVYDGTNDVEYGHQRQPAQRCFINGVVKAVRNNVMHGGNYTTETKTDEDT